MVAVILPVVRTSVRTGGVFFSPAAWACCGWSSSSTPELCISI